MNDRIEKTKKLQEQFICPIFAVWFGSSVKVFYTDYHAEQFARALRMNGTEFDALDGKGNAI